MNPPPKLSLRLRPHCGGAYTEILLSGPMHSVPPPTQLRRFFALLWGWNGYAVDVALCVDGTNEGACWAEVWENALAQVPGRHQRVRFLISRETLAAGGDDDR